MAENSYDILEAAKLVAKGDLKTPYPVGDSYLMDVRITGTGIADRSPEDDKNELVYRPQDSFLTQDFLERCKAVPLILQHPETNYMTKEDAIKGVVVYPYFKTDDKLDLHVRGVARVFDLDFAKQMRELSTSPGMGVIETYVKLDDGRVVSIEDADRVTLIDHIAVVPLGVWDKGLTPAGVRKDAKKKRGLMKQDTLPMMDAVAPKKDGEEELKKHLETLFGEKGELAPTVAKSPEVVDKYIKQYQKNKAEATDASAEPKKDEEKVMEEKKDAVLEQVEPKKDNHLAEQIAELKAAIASITKAVEGMNAAEASEVPVEDEDKKEEEVKKDADAEIKDEVEAKKDADEEVKEEPKKDSKKDSLTISKLEARIEKMQKDALLSAQERKSLEKKVEAGLALMNRERTEAERNQISVLMRDYQPAMDSLSLPLPRPIHGETPDEYDRRMIGLIAKKTNTYKDERFDGYSRVVLDSVRPKIIAEATEATTKALTSGNKSFVRSRQDGQKLIKTTYGSFADAMRDAGAMPMAKVTLAKPLTMN